MEPQPRTARMTGPEETDRARPTTLHDRAPAPVDPAVPGTVLGDRYRVGECIGSGAMGVVWTAWDRRLRRTVAVKQLGIPREGDPVEVRAARMRAMREGRIAARVVHPRAIAVFDVVTHDSMPWLVMEYLPSRSLATVLAEQGPLEPTAVARIGAQIADALSAVHDAGIVHGDVKPGNVLLTDDGVAKLTDFGVSRASWDSTNTGGGMVAGTPGYFAPEVARGQEPTSASDVFSLGATLYAAVENELVCGRLDNTLAVLHAMAEGRLRPATRAGVLSQPLAAMLRNDPDERPGTVEVRRLLDQRSHGPSGVAAVLAGGAAARPAPGPVPGTPGEEQGPTATAPDAVGPGAAAAAAAPVLPPSAVAARGPAGRPGPAVPAARTAGPTAAAGAVGAARTGRTGTTTPPARGGRRRRRLAVVAAVSAVVLAAGVGAGLAAVGDSSARVAEPAAPARVTPSTEQAVTAPPSVAPTTEPQAAAPLSPGASTTTPPPTTTSAAAGADDPVSEDEVRSTVADYYGSLPDDVDGAWAVLSDSARDASGGFSGYQRFWSGIASVSAGDVRVDGDTARTSLTFVTDDGRTTREGYTFEVGRGDDGKLQIQSANRSSDSA